VITLAPNIGIFTTLLHSLRLPLPINCSFIVWTIVKYDWANKLALHFIDWIYSQGSYISPLKMSNFSIFSPSGQKKSLRVESKVSGSKDGKPLIYCKVEMGPDPTRIYFWPAVKKRLTRLRPGYFPSRPEDIFLTRPSQFTHKCYYFMEMSIIYSDHIKTKLLHLGWNSYKDVEHDFKVLV